MASDIDLRKFVHADNAEYSKWFSDKNMNKYLGPAWTEQELIQIFEEEPGSVLSVFRSEKLIGVISFAPVEKSCIAITGIAINPKYQRSGIGKSIIQRLPVYFNTCSGQKWSCSVDYENIASQLFLEKIGWQKGTLVNNYFQYSFEQP